MDKLLLAQARAWLEQDPDPATREELTALLAASDYAELAARFDGQLAFGTAGLRGVVGAGPQRMNVVVVRRTTAGLADYLCHQDAGAAERGVVVAFDARTDSLRFAHQAARVLLGRGLRVHLATEPTPTPVAAFALRALNAAAAIVVTASHNPPEYNGYKVFWGNGAQIIPPHDQGISAAIDMVGPADQLPLGELASAIPLPPELQQRYLTGIAELVPRRDREPLVIAYTPLHGVGASLVERALAAAGHSVHTVPSQREPDGRFPTVAFPNPEEPGAMDLLLELATSRGADLALANDPDADRLAVAVPNGAHWRVLTGDQTGVLLGDYLLELTADSGPAPLLATTIVSSQLLPRLAESAGAACTVTLTGLKWIANAAIDHARDHGSRLLLGYEEALGYCIGELVRDKDGISAAAVFAELAAYEKARGRTVLHRLDDIYRRHGVYLTGLAALNLPGADGRERIAELMTLLRATPPTELGGHAVVECHDLAAGALGLPKSNVVIMRLAGGHRVIMRPSGTEPKLKCYYEVCVPVTGEVEPAMEQAKTTLELLRTAHQALLQ